MNMMVPVNVHFTLLGYLNASEAVVFPCFAYSAGLFCAAKTKPNQTNLWHLKRISQQASMMKTSTNAPGDMTPWHHLPALIIWDIWVEATVWLTVTVH